MGRKPPHYRCLLETRTEKNFMFSSCHVFGVPEKTYKPNGCFSSRGRHNCSLIDLQQHDHFRQNLVLSEKAFTKD